MSVFTKIYFHWQRLRSNLLPAGAAKASAPLYICTVFKNEAAFLPEWLDFHLARGVEHFVLIDNFSEDEPEAVLRPYLEAGQLSLLQTLSRDMSAEIQARELNRGLHYLRAQGRGECWCAFIDVDEYLFACGRDSLKQVIASFGGGATGAILANWLMFGTAGVEVLDRDRPMIEQLTRRAPDRMNEHRLFKPICWLPNVLAFVGGPHLPVLRRNAGVYYSNGDRYQDGTDRFIHKPLRINHYWYRSEQYYQEVKIPKRLAFAPPREKEIARLHYQACNQIEDRSILTP